MNRFINAIAKVIEGSIGRYKYAGFEVTPDEISKRMKIACKAVANMLRNFLEDNGITPDERDIKAVASCIKDPHEVMEKYGIEPDWYFPDPDEIAAEIVMRKALASIPDAPSDAEVAEEEGYGLPPYSLYWSPDARSFVGKWYYSDARDKDICWGLISDLRTCEKIENLVKKLEEHAEKRGNKVLFAVWRT